MRLNTFHAHQAPITVGRTSVMLGQTLVIEGGARQFLAGERLSFAGLVLRIGNDKLVRKQANSYHDHFPEYKTSSADWSLQIEILRSSCRIRQNADRNLCVPTALFRILQTFHWHTQKSICVYQVPAEQQHTWCTAPRWHTNRTAWK